ASVEVALLIREGLRELGLDGWAKTSGAGGMHVLVPIARRSGYDDTYEFAERLSRLLEERHPGVLTTQWRKEKRRGVLVDHRQHGGGKTIASAYSVRPKPGAPVSTPLRWEELDGRLDYSRLGMAAARKRLERLRNPVVERVVAALLWVAVALLAVAAAVAEDVERAGVALALVAAGVVRRVRVVQVDAHLVGLPRVVDVAELEVGVVEVDVRLRMLRDLEARVRHRRRHQALTACEVDEA